MTQQEFLKLLGVKQPEEKQEEEVKDLREPCPVYYVDFKNKVLMRKLVA